jgi:hypothetical protein
MGKWAEVLCGLTLPGPVPDFGDDDDRVEVSCELVEEEIDRRFAIREDDEEIADFWERGELEVDE